jgi:hypothetical protein
LNNFCATKKKKKKKRSIPLEKLTEFIDVSQLAPIIL